VVLRHRQSQPRYLRLRDRLLRPGRLPRREKHLGFDGHPSEIYVRTTDTQAAVTRVDKLLSPQANPESPSQVNVSRSSDALTARAETQGALDTLFLGLGAVALLVGAIGVANVMIISVLERRSEIGLRRALDATRGQIRAQFLTEAIILSLAGGATGVILGAAAVTAYARTHGEAVVIPAAAWAGGLAAAILIGAIAGLLPAIRAARLSPLKHSGASDRTANGRTCNASIFPGGVAASPYRCRRRGRAWSTGQKQHL
jgi:putative ABC transport system permease protein